MPTGTHGSIFDTLPSVSHSIDGPSLSCDISIGNRACVTRLQMVNSGYSWLIRYINSPLSSYVRVVWLLSSCDPGGHRGATTRAPYHSSQATAAHKDVGLQEIAYTGTRSPWETSNETETSSPAAPKVVMLTNPDVASDENLAKMTTPQFQRGSIWPRNSHWASFWMCWLSVLSTLCIKCVHYIFTYTIQSTLPSLLGHIVGRIILTWFSTLRNTHKCVLWSCHQPSSFDLTFWHVSQNTSIHLLTFV